MKSGFVALAGQPNVGKSTLLNRLVGQKLAITSARPQSTRQPVTGILTEPDAQFVFVDTPGLLEPATPLQQSMRAAALRALADADVILHLVDARDARADSLAAVAGLDTRPRAPIIVVRTKADLLAPDERASLAAAAPDQVLVSATTGEGLGALRTRILEHLPEGPRLYPEDEASTQHLRFFVAELVRETALEELDDEVPHAVACTIEEFREDRDPLYIRAVIHVERDSQKRIVIGHQGERIRAIGQSARLKIEALLSTRVYLDLWVKVLPNWRRDRAALRRLGYNLPEVT